MKEEKCCERCYEECDCHKELKSEMPCDCPSEPCRRHSLDEEIDEELREVLDEPIMKEEKKTEAWEKRKIYDAMDSFLVEGTPIRTIERLNQDRHLFVKRMEEIIASEKEASYKEGQESVKEKLYAEGAYELGRKEGVNEVLKNIIADILDASDGVWHLKEIVKSLNEYKI